MAITTVNTTDLYDNGFLSGITNPEPLALVPNSISSARFCTYMARLDRLYAAARNNSGTVIRFGYVDPLLADGAYPITNFTQGVAYGAPLLGAFVGQWNRSADQQRLYTLTATTTAGLLQERDPTTLQIIDVDPYPLFRNQCIVVGSTVDGYYQALAYDYVIFEEQGKLYCPHATVRYGGVTYTEVMIEVDLATGLAVPVADIPGKATAAPNAFQEPQLFGDTVDWTRIQFVDDDDSSHISPKGYFVISEEDGQAGTGGGGQASERAYLRIVEWNPTGASGTPNRVHKRITLTSRIEFDETIVGVNFASAALVFHPYSERLYWIANNGTNPLVSGTNVAYRFSLVPTLSAITAAAPERTPRTAGTTAFFVEALGSLAERIPGVTVQYTLEGASTVLELLDTSAGVGGAAGAVANAPIDDDEGLEVYEDDGVNPLALLAETTDYTVNLATGVITGVAPHWKVTSDYYASYNHKEATNGVTPLGTLLLPIVETDNLGKARTRVRYADDDDLVGRYDKLSAETT
jgi:hypothetical protein